jgi:hypothetical protein
VHAHQHAVGAGEIAVTERDMFVIVDVVPVGVDPPIFGPDVRRQPGLGHAVHQFVRLQAMRDQVGDRDEREAVLRRITIERIAPHRVAVIVEDLTDDAGGREAGQPAQVDRCLGVPDALQHTSAPRAQRMDVTRRPNVSRPLGRVSDNANGRSAIRRTDAGRHAVLLSGIHAHGKSRAHRVRVFAGLQ